MKETYISLRKRIFQCFFLSFPCFEWKWRKSKKYINFSWHFIFSSQNCINYPVSSVSWSIYIFSKKGHLYFGSEKRNICNFTKKVSFHRKKFFFWWFPAYFIVFININKKNTEYCHNILFFLNKKNNVFFNVFRSINGILNKKPFLQV